VAKAGMGGITAIVGINARIARAARVAIAGIVGIAAMGGITAIFARAARVAIFISHGYI